MSFLGVSVLLVEDNESDVKFIRHVLVDQTPMGATPKYNIEVAETLVAAIKKIQFGLEIILLDLDLPDSKGLDTFRGVSKIMPDIPVIILTGQSGFDVSVEAIKAGAFRWLFKQWIVDVPEILHYTIADAAEMYRQAAQLHLLGSIRLGRLRNLIMQCAYCNKLKRESSGQYVNLIDYMKGYGIDLTHGICPPCAERQIAIE